MRQTTTQRRSIIRWSMFAAGAAMVAALTLPAPAEAATIDSRFDICAALRNGTSLAEIETTLEARGYNATNAGVLTGTTIRQHCPDQAGNAMAQARNASANAGSECPQFDALRIRARGATRVYFTGLSSGGAAGTRPGTVGWSGGR